jgi:prepilin-type processing-associated H-X9-DG protein
MRRYVCLLLVLAVSACSWCQQTPEDVIRAFAQSWNARDPQAMANLVVGGRLGKEARDADTWKDMPTVEVSNMDTNINRNFATVTLQLTMSVNGKQTLSTEDTVYLNQFGSQWLIIAANPHDPLEASIRFMALMVSDPDFFARQKSDADMHACGAHLGQVGLGLIMLAADSDGVLKFDATQEAARKAVAPYLSREGLWTGPGLDGKLFSVNMELVGKKLLDPTGPLSPEDPKIATVHPQVAHPELVVLAYEGADGKLDFPHRGKTAIVFLDGHVKFMTQHEAKAVVWKP